MLPLDTDTMSDITGDVKVLFVNVWTPFKVTSPWLDGTTTVKVIFTEPIEPELSVVHKKNLSALDVPSWIITNWPASSATVS